MECCGQPVIYDEVDGSPIMWCPSCGKDYTYECYEEQYNTDVSRVKRELGWDEIPSLCREKV